MKQLESPTVRAIVGVVVGIPGTLVLGWLALFQAGIGAVGMPLSLWESLGGHLRANYVASQFGWSALALVWGLAGVAGVVGFWSWVFSARPFAQRKRRWLIALLCAGVAAAMPVAIVWPGIVAWLAVAGIVTGAAIVANMCFLTNRWSGP